MPFVDGEEIVAGMQAKAELVIKEVMAEFTISHVCAAFSGGNDSIVATHWAMNRFPGCVAITADTQIGLKAARDHQQAVCDLFKWNREVKCGISGECCCGSFAAVGEREAYRQVEPEFAEYLDQIEAKVRQKFPWGWGETQPKWWNDAKKGQTFLFDAHAPDFMPACVGCQKKTRPTD